MTVEQIGESLTVDERIAMLHRSLDKTEKVAELARTRVRAIEQQIDDLRLTTRPTYPTRAQILGIAEAARQVKAGIVPSTHHGDPCAPLFDDGRHSTESPSSYDVVVDGRRGFIRLANKAPYSKRGSGQLWDYTDDELEAIFAEIRTHGLAVVEHWRSSGISIIVTEAPS